MEKLFRSGDIELAGHLARPRVAPGTSVPGLLICHGFPNLNQGGALSARSFPELAERIATEMGWMVLVVTFRGAGDSEGDFSMQGWRDDLLAAAAYLRSIEGVHGVWVSQPRLLLQHARATGIISSPTYPENFDVWAKEIRGVHAVAEIRAVAPRPVLIMHGSEDDVVPVFDARVLADAHGSADLRIIDGGAHQLRHDPRAVAVLLGWLDRQRAAAAAQRAV